MPTRNILVFADGTGNEGGLLPDAAVSNVYKLYRATRVDVESTIDPALQIAHYVSGIGTPVPGAPWSIEARSRDLWDQAVGGGLSRKIAQCYAAIIGSWEPGDRIYLFGFSRGAYTVRCLAHVLELLGIPTRNPDGTSISLDPKHLLSLALSGVRTIYPLAMPVRDYSTRAVKADAFKEKYGCVTGVDRGVIPYFIGVWDTVSAIGWERIFPHRQDEHIPDGVAFARHALAIDEYRKDFLRVRWGGSKTVHAGRPGEPPPFEQVWFAGCHADIGGGYPENESRLSDITLDWMVRFVTEELPLETRLIVDDRFLNLHPSPDGMMHDECMSGGPVAWKKIVRPIDPSAVLHPSVYARLAMASVRNFVTFGPYRPANLRDHKEAALFLQREHPSQPSRATTPRAP